MVSLYVRLCLHMRTRRMTQKKSKHHAVHHDQKEQRRWCLGVWHHLCVLACERLTCSRVNVISVVQGNAIRMQPAVCAGVRLHKGTSRLSVCLSLCLSPAAGIGLRPAGQVCCVDWHRLRHLPPQPQATPDRAALKTDFSLTPAFEPSTMSCRR